MNIIHLLNVTLKAGKEIVVKYSDRNQAELQFNHIAETMLLSTACYGLKDQLTGESYCIMAGEVTCVMIHADQKFLDEKEEALLAAMDLLQELEEENKQAKESTLD